MKRFRLFCSLTLLLATGIIPAQEPDYRPNLIPPSPDASALGKYAEYPVGLYTGTLPINIPLYTVNDGSLNVPVSLSYHGSGNKVEEAASFAGLGFALNAGGAIMRSVRNLPDDHPVKGFLDYSITYSENYLNTNANRFTQWEEIAKGCADAEPDLYFFNFNGYTGSFTFDWAGQLKINSPVAWKTQVLRQDSNNPKKITGWKFINDNGTSYTFDIAEQATITGNGFSCQAGISYNSAWYLRQVTSPNGGRTINFTYENYTQNFNTYSDVSHRIFCYPSQPFSCQVTANEPTMNLIQMVYNCRRVKTIVTSDNGTTLTFNYLANRSDEPGTDVKQLDELTIKNKDGAEIRKFSFTYDYSTGRLSLRSVKKALTDEPPYKFDYHEEVLPKRTGNGGTGLSFGQDHWGYFNGKADNPNLLLPVWKRNPNLVFAPQIFYKGGDRTPDENKMKAGILTRITYPAGQIDEFFYRTHEYGFIGNQTVQSLGETVMMEDGTEEKVASISALADNGPSTQTSLLPELWGENGSDAVVHLEFSGIKAPANGESYIEIYKNGESQPLYRLDFTRNGPPFRNDYITLPRGQYLLKARASTRFIVNVDGTNTEFIELASVIMRWNARKYTAVPLKKKKCGGLRIWVVRNSAYPGAPYPTYRDFVYDDGITPDETSSGVLNETPAYESGGMVYYAAGESACTYDLRITQNKAILGYGPHIGYGKVTEVSGNSGSNGKTVYGFVTEKDYPAIAYKQPPFQQSSVNSFAPGNPLGSSIFKKESGTYKPVREGITTNYEIHALTTVSGLKFHFQGGTNAAAKFTKGRYETWMGDWYPSLIQEKEYATDAINFQQKNKTFVYENKRLREERLDLYRNIAGSEVVSYFYADDFENPTLAVQSMLNKNMIGLPLETVKSRPNGLSNGITAAVFNNYTLDASSRVFLSEIKKLQLSSILPSGSFGYAAYNPTGVVDSRYSTETTFEKYDAKENLTQLTGRDGLTKSFLYDKHDQGPVVAANGVAWDKMVWSGFEGTDPIAHGVANVSGTYNTTDFATGKRSFNGALTINVSSFPATSHVLSFWMKGTNAFDVSGVTVPATSAWTFYETRIIPGSMFVSISTNGGLIDELRIYPAEAQLTTTSYDQLIGQNGVADVKSKPSFYEYDNLWRLHLVKDQNKDIVKRSNYEFEILAPLAYTLTVTQTGNYTYQFQVVGGSAGYVYEWDFDDLSAITSGTATTVSHTFPSLTLLYNVKVKVKNSVNALATLTKEVTVIKTGGSTSICNELQSITITRNASVPKEVTVSIPAISGATYWWDFGDNTYASTLSATHTYPAATVVNIYSIIATVSAGGKSCSTRTSVKINP